jgi:succinate dehydrogenase / fumarate reductase cytochrome b subunit
LSSNTQKDKNKIRFNRIDMAILTTSIPKEFIWRRVHSLTGLFFTLYLMLHLYVNSQAGLWIGDDGQNYIRSVNSIQEFPYLIALEILLLGVPIVLHTVLGIRYLFISKQNAYGAVGTQPYLPQYGRNRAYTWQRITAWILVLGVAGHIIHMRFLEYPVVTSGPPKEFITRLSFDPGLTSVAQRLNVKLYRSSDIAQMKADIAQQPSTAHQQRQYQRAQQLEAMERKPLKPNQVLAVANNFGTVTLLMVRDSFKIPLMMALYTLFVLASCFHGFNGLWTFAISWGLTITTYSQRLILKIATALMVIVALLGLASIFLTYWVNLKQ